MRYLAPTFPLFLGLGGMVPAPTKSLADSKTGERVHRGEALLVRRKPAAAEAEFRAAIQAEPGLAAAHWGRGEALAVQGKLAEAEEAYRGAISLDPENAGYQFRLGDFLLGAAKVEVAIDPLRAAIIQDVTSWPSAPYVLFDALRRLGRHAESADVMRETLAHHPDNIAAHGNLGMALATLGKPGEAEAEFRSSNRLKPDAMGLNRLARRLAELGNRDEAETLFRRAIQFDPDYKLARDNLDRLLKKQGR